jgi:hypothetical protein
MTGGNLICIRFQKAEQGHHDKMSRNKIKLLDGTSSFSLNFFSLNNSLAAIKFSIKQCVGSQV